jgi:hypothetical protein
MSGKLSAHGTTPKHTNAYCEGRRWAASGALANTNPHVSGSELYTAWAAGWTSWKANPSGVTVADECDSPYGGGYDTTAPTLLGAVVGRVLSETADVVELHFSEPLTAPHPALGWEVTVDDAGVDISSGVLFSPQIIHLVLAAPVYVDAVVVVDYDATTGDTTDAKGYPALKDLADIVSAPVTNLSTVEAPSEG